MTQWAYGILRTGDTPLTVRLTRSRLTPGWDTEFVIDHIGVFDDYTWGAFIRDGHIGIHGYALDDDGIVWVMDHPGT